MTQAPRLNPGAMDQPQSAAILLLLTILDTTWRVFIPPIAGTILGVYLDNLLNHPPLFTSLLIVTGCALSAGLIASQYKQVARS